MTFYPIARRVLIRPLEPKTVTAGGIHLPHPVGPDVTGVVTAIGPDADPDLQVGHTVLFSPYVGQEVQLRETRYLLMDDSDISAILTAEDAEPCPSCGRPLPVEVSA